ncbi:hypothetical protein [Arthrobacter humicola]|uniref:hypothetical protein n=1 Tax=Arthrobacter humicola TaxID=409291 RepID=UPI0031D81EA4
MTTATTAPVRRTRRAAAPIKPREEVTTMMTKLYKALFLTRKPTRKESTRFNGQLLDQKRDDVFLAIHQAGLFR